MICFPLIKVACNFVFLRNGRLEVLLEETAKVIHHQAAERCFQEGQPRFPASAAHFCVPPCSTPVLARLVRRIIQGPTATEEGLFFFAGLLLCYFSSLNWIVGCLGRSLGGNWLQSWVEEGLGAMLSALDSLRVEEQHHKPEHHKSESYPASKHWACSA